MPAAKKQRTLWIVLGVVGVLLLLQVVRYMLWGERSMPRTVAKLLPQHTHMRGGALRFAWVDDETWSSLSPEQRQALDSVLLRHFGVVYYGRDAIPGEYLIYSPPDLSRLSGLKGGCIIEWELRRRGPFWFTASYSDWESLTAASHRRATFAWLVGWRIHVWSDPTAIC